MNFVARTEEITKLNIALKEARRGKLKIVFVTGNAGIGKTALVSEFLKHLDIKKDKLLIATSKCLSIASGQQSPYFPFAYILQQIAKKNRWNVFWERTSKAIMELAPEWIPLMLPLTKDFFTAINSTTKWLKQEFGGSGEFDNKYLMIQYTNTLRTITKDIPMILWIDDLHWADNATLEMLTFMATYAVDLRILLICGLRSENISSSVNGQRHPISFLLENLGNNDVITQISLRNFNLAELENYLLSHDHKLETKIIRNILVYSGGNPLFIREFINLLHARKVFQRIDGVFQLLDEKITLEVPKKLENIVSQKIALLDTKSRRLVNYASVMGDVFSSQILGSLLELTEISVYEILDHLTKGFQITEEIVPIDTDNNQNAEYRFSHTLIQQAIYEQLGFAQRRKMHLEIAQILEKNPTITHSSILTIASHFEKAEDFRNSSKYYLIASKNALNFLALDDALAYTQKASLLLSRKILSGDRTEEANVLLTQIEIFFLKGEFDHVLKLCERGKKTSSEELTLVNLTFYYWEGTALAYLGFDEKAVKHIKFAISALERSSLASNNDGERLLTQLYIRLGQKHQLLETEEAIRVLDHAIFIANKNRYYDMEIDALRFKGWVAANRQSNFDEALKIGKMALRIATEQNIIWGQIHSHRLIAHANRLLGQNQDGFTNSLSANNLAHQHGLHLAEHLTLLSLAISCQNTGSSWEQSFTHLQQSIELADKYAFNPNQGNLTTLFHVALGLGRWPDAQIAINRYQETFSSEKINKNYVRYFEGQLAFAKGELQQAIAFFEDAANGLHTNDFLNRRLLHTTKLFLGMTLIAEGNTARANSLLQEAYEYWSNQKSSTWLSHSIHALGMLYQRQGDTFTAIAQYQNAISKIKNENLVNAWPIKPFALLSLSQAWLEQSADKNAFDCALQAYNSLKNMNHFLQGDAAFLVGRSLLMSNSQSKENALRYIYDAKQIWESLKLQDKLLQWESFVKANKLF